MPDPKSVRDILDDIGRELDGDTLEGELSARGFKAKVRLLTEEESNWRFARVDPSTPTSAISSFRLPTLAIGIREIYHEKLGRWVSVYEFFDDEWEKLPEDARDALMSTNKFSKKYFIAEYLMQWLSQRREIIKELYDQWTELEQRRSDAQAALKKSSGEGSEEEKSKNSTDPSPDGGC